MLAKIIQYRRWLILLGLIAIGCGSWAVISSSFSPEKSPIRPPRASKLPQHPLIQAYFNHNDAASYLEPYRPFQRSGDDLEAKIIETIDQAHSSIDIAVQELKLPRIAMALVKKQQAGVKVRLILEHRYSSSWSDLSSSAVEKLPPRERERYQEFLKLVDIDRNGQLSPEEINKRDALKILQATPIPLLDDTADGSAGSGLMHHKFLVVDGHKSLITSANWTMSDIHGDLSRPASRGNQNNLLVIESPELAQALTTEFNLMWGDGPGGQPNSQFGINKTGRSPISIPVGDSRITIHFSPAAKSQDWQATSNGLIARTLQQARQQTDLALFVFSEPQITPILQGIQQQGVKIRALIDRDFAFRPYSQLLPMLGIQACRQPHPAWTQPLTTAGVTHLPPGDLLHHKFAVIDQKIVITGSHNWSKAANHQNDETLLIVDSPIVAAHFQQEFDRLYQTADFGKSVSIQQKQSTCSPQTNNIENQ